MRIDGGVSANCFDHRDVEQVASRLIFTAAHDPRLSGTSHTKFVPVWRVRNPLSHPRVPPRTAVALEFAGGPHSLFVLRSVYQTSGGLKPCAALAAPVAAPAFGSSPGPVLDGPPPEAHTRSVAHAHAINELDSKISSKEAGAVGGWPRQCERARKERNRQLPARPAKPVADQGL
jgi:hypothetical protein